MLDLRAGDLGATMASRWTVNPAFVFLNVKVNPTTHLILIQADPDLGVPDAVVPNNILPGHPHFPYGWSVEPDGPV